VVCLLPWLIPDLRKGRPRAHKVAGSGRVWPFIMSNPRYFFCHFLGFGLIAMLAFGTAAWMPALLMRHMGMEIGSVGLFMGGVGVTIGLTGYAGNGWVVDRWFAAGQRDAHLRFFAYGCVAMALAAPIAFLSTSLWVFLPFYSVIVVLAPFSGPAVAHLQMATPPELRGQISAIYALTYNMIGMCLGPSSVAALTDYVFHDPLMVNKSMAIMVFCTGLAASAVFFAGLKASRRALGDAV
jgi:MFS family permease